MNVCSWSSINLCRVYYPSFTKTTMIICLTAPLFLRRINSNCGRRQSKRRRIFCRRRLTSKGVPPFNPRVRVCPFNLVLGYAPFNSRLRVCPPSTPMLGYVPLRENCINNFNNLKIFILYYNNNANFYGLCCD